MAARIEVDHASAAMPLAAIVRTAGDQAVENGVIVSVIVFSILYSGLFVVSGMVTTLFVEDPTTAVTVSATTIGNLGPGPAGVGPAGYPANEE